MDCHTIVLSDKQIVVLLEIFFIALYSRARISNLSVLHLKKSSKEKQTYQKTPLTTEKPCISLVL